MALLDSNNDVTILKSEDSFDVYSLNGNDICLFCVPNRFNGSMSFYLDLNRDSDYNDLLQGKTNQDSVVSLIKGDYAILKNTHENAILVVPKFDVASLSKAIDSNDKQAIFSSIGGIGKCTKEIQSLLAKKGIAIDTNINVVIKNDIDNKFAKWLEGQNIGKGISFEELKGKSNNVGNPFMANNNPFVGGEVQNNQSSDIFSGPINNLEPQINNPEPQINNPNPQIISSEPPVQNVVQGEAQVQGPQPIQGVVLEAPHMENGQENATGDDEQGGTSTANVGKKKLGNRGYVNIIILMAILVGVTILSIQLGKFLFSIYG